LTSFVRVNKDETGAQSGTTDAYPETETTGSAAQQARVGFTASKKVGSAVARNRARRRLRAVAAEVLPRLGLAGTDYVLIARAGTLTRDYGDLTRDLLKALEIVGLPEEVYQDRQRKTRRPVRAGNRGRKPGPGGKERGKEGGRAKPPLRKAKTGERTAQ
jgi:ribonuclease P protein component